MPPALLQTSSCVPHKLHALPSFQERPSSFTFCFLPWRPPFLPASRVVEGGAPLQLLVLFCLGVSAGAFIQVTVSSKWDDLRVKEKMRWGGWQQLLQRMCMRLK